MCKQCQNDCHYTEADLIMMEKMLDGENPDVDDEIKVDYDPEFEERDEKVTDFEVLMGLLQYVGYGTISLIVGMSAIAGIVKIAELIK